MFISFRPSTILAERHFPHKKFSITSKYSKDTSKSVHDKELLIVALDWSTYGSCYFQISIRHFTYRFLYKGIFQGLSPSLTRTFLASMIPWGLLLLGSVTRPPGEIPKIPLCFSTKNQHFATCALVCPCWCIMSVYLPITSCSFSKPSFMAFGW